MRAIMHSNGGPDIALKVGRLEGQASYNQRWLTDHETRLRKVETRLQRGAIIASLMTSGLVGNLTADQIADIILRIAAVLKGG